MSAYSDLMALAMQLLLAAQAETDGEKATRMGLDAARIRGWAEEAQNAENEGRLNAGWLNSTTNKAYGLLTKHGM